MSSGPKQQCARSKRVATGCAKGTIKQKLVEYFSKNSNCSQHYGLRD
jgi:hypothetical protein